MRPTAEQLAAAVAVGLRDDIRLLRRVFPSWHGADGKPDSSNFKKDPDGGGTSMTVWFSHEDYEAVTAGHDSYGVVWVPAAALHAEGLQIVSDPLAEDPCHVLIEGDRGKRAIRNIRDRAQWVRYPVPFNLAEPPQLAAPEDFNDTL